MIEPLTEDELNRVLKGTRITDHYLRHRCGEVWFCDGRRSVALIQEWKARTTRPWSRQRVHQIFDNWHRPTLMPVIAMLCCVDMNLLRTGDAYALFSAQRPSAVTDEEKLAVRERGARILDAMTLGRTSNKAEGIAPVSAAALLVALSSDEQCEALLKEREGQWKTVRALKPELVRGKFPRYCKVTWRDEKGVEHFGKIDRTLAKPSVKADVGRMELWKYLVIEEDETSQWKVSVPGNLLKKYVQGEQ